ncbi:hypothetical protein DSO57_1030087 [Entomophthora muscae]|uniref:Uncharacterized protein n=1 Tax=Entomophthora muscae TaxID=34485 RepID=A0ACC2TMS7_9FUNG|nr:hypothetical protein DSO57_1030087 [Entomophthora muscae]
MPDLLSGIAGPDFYLILIESIPDQLHTPSLSAMMTPLIGFTSSTALCSHPYQIDELLVASRNNYDQLLASQNWAHSLLKPLSANQHDSLLVQQPLHTKVDTNCTLLSTYI